MKIPTLIPGLIPLLTVLTSGCANTSAVTPNDFVTQWQDKPKAELLEVLGPPASIISLPGGESLLTWERVQRHPSGIGRMHNPEAYYTRCELACKVDPASTILAEQETCS